MRNRCVRRVDFAGRTSTGVRSRASRCCTSAIRFAYSSSVRNSRVPNSAGRSNGTPNSPSLVHSPCRSGSPHEVRRAHWSGRLLCASARAVNPARCAHNPTTNTNAVVLQTVPMFMLLPPRDVSGQREHEQVVAEARVELGRQSVRTHRSQRTSPCSLRCIACCLRQSLRGSRKSASQDSPPTRLCRSAGRMRGSGRSRHRRRSSRRRSTTSESIAGPLLILPERLAGFDRNRVDAARRSCRSAQPARRS